jgi:signal transduction histidine kinase
VSDLLNYSRERDLVVQPLDLEEQLAEVSEVISRDPRCASGVRVRFERQGVAGDVAVDREQIRQVWLNLAVNALEAMAGGGELTVRWHEGERGTLVVEFVDQGPGIAAEELPRVGQPFYTTKQGGTGLGVAIAQRIVERHGGSLTLDSEVGRGTIARVTLPGASAPVAKAA